MDTVRIAILGAHGTGKSTLARFLSSRIDAKHYGFSEVIVNPEVARKCPYPVGAKSDPIAQEWIFAKQEEMEREARGLSIADNCLLGQYTYFRYWCGEDTTRLSRALELLGKYAVVVLLPADPSLLEDDGIRPTDPVFQTTIDSSLRSLLAESGVAVTLLPRISPGDRRRNALDTINTALDIKYSRQLPIALGFVVSGEYLLLNQRLDPLVPLANKRWDVVAGRVEFGEQPDETIRRECKEEIGLDIATVEPIPISSSHVWQRTDGRFQSIILPFVCTTENGLVGMEHRVTKVGEVRWVRLQDAASYDLMPNLLPFIEYIQKRR